LLYECFYRKSLKSMQAYKTLDMGRSDGFGGTMTVSVTRVPSKASHMM
jgi:hypothetical protein